MSHMFKNQSEQVLIIPAREGYNVIQVLDVNTCDFSLVNTLKFEKHTNAKIVTANKILGITRRTYMILNKEKFWPLYKAFGRSHFDYVMSIVEQQNLFQKLRILHILKTESTKYSNTFIQKSQVDMIVLFDIN